ncbi:hypothetical protein [Hymenobacter volaticus]|uniref:hypothetical protein n=1 Tax=Hymenobacter volaticus TaxID=2932254 RepID=UPI0035CA7C31
MRNKGLIIGLTVIVSALCIYFLTFTFISRRVQNDAVVYATKNGQVNQPLRQHYLDSVWRAPVTSLLGVDYTYRDVRSSELGLGLDLKGGMHVTLEVSPVEIVRAMSGNSKDPKFNRAIEQAQTAQKANPSTPFTTLFAQAYRDVAPATTWPASSLTPPTKAAASISTPPTRKCLALSTRKWKRPSTVHSTFSARVSTSLVPASQAFSA